MMKYLFDTNLCVAIINGTASQYALKMLSRYKATGDEFFLPSLAVHELWYGVANSQRVANNSENLRKFLTGPTTILGFDSEDARVAAEIRAELRRRGTPIGPYDLLIAGQALARGLVVVTRNTREFERERGLKVEDWS